MRQVNFFLLFVFALALVLFALANPHTASLKVLPQLTITAPISLEIIGAIGFGAVLAWFFSFWSEMQRTLVEQSKVTEINELQQQVTTLSVKLEERKQLMSAQAIDVDPV
ncbi:MAG: LapA family protein [Pseudanabaenaceae cyanobacterium]|jgi:putative membrane protein